MRLSFSPAAHFCLFLVQWADCNLAGALGLLRILIYTTYSDGKTTMFVHEKQASIKEFYGVIFPSLLQLQTGVTEFEARKQKELCSSKYRRYGLHERREFTKLEKELEEECGICMEMNAKVVLPNCCHSLCFKCYQDCLRSDCTFFLQLVIPSLAPPQHSSGTDLPSIPKASVLQGYWWDLFWSSSEACHFINQRCMRVTYPFDTRPTKGKKIHLLREN